MKFKIWIALIFITALFLTITACTSNKPLDMLDPQKISNLGIECQEISTRQVDAWATKDSGNLRGLYTDDIVDFDGEPEYIGIEEVIGMADDLFRLFPEWQMAAGEDTYISADKCFGIWLNWGIMDIPQSTPGLEYDLLETRDGKISYWTHYYSRNFMDPQDLSDVRVRKFASTWSQGDPQKIQALYTKDAEFEDTLFGFSGSGQRKISNYASRFLAKAPDSGWELITSFHSNKAEFPYKEEYPFRSEGGIFAVTVTDDNGKSCKLQVAIILTPNDEGLITKQETFYSADSLIACGWAD